MVEINIRLDVAGKRFSDKQFHQRAQRIVALLCKFGTVEHRVRQIWIDQPRHLIALVHVDDIPEAALVKLAKQYGQQCLGIYYPDRKEGRLVGPSAGEWGLFNLEKFERFDAALSIKPPQRFNQSLKYVPSTDPDAECAKMEALYERCHKVFIEDAVGALAPQQKSLTDAAIQRVLQAEGPDALTVPRLEGIYELVTEHLWSPAFTAVSNTNNKSGAEQ